MYEFNNTTKSNAPLDKVFIPTSAMNYNGSFLENVISGYQTLAVEGREMHSLSLETKDIHVGTYITTSRIPPKIITVSYKLYDPDPIALQSKFDDLMAFLYKEKDVAITFKDMPGFTFYGRFSSCGNVDGDRNAIISTLEFLLSDPFKYQEQKTVVDKVTEKLPYQISPDFISFTATGVEAVLKINGYVLKLIGLTIASQIELDFINGTIKLNGVVNNKLLSLDSDFKNVKITTNSSLTGTGFKETTIKYRKAVL